MPALAITLNQLAAALLGAGAYIYHTKQRHEWKACAVVCGCLIQRSSPDPYAALGAVAQVLIDYEAQQAAQDLVLTPAARAAYKAAWAASEGQQVPARFAAAEAAAAATSDELDYEWRMSLWGCLGRDDEADAWSQTIRTEQDNARTMQRLHSITGRPSAAGAAAAAIGDEQPVKPICEGCEEYVSEVHDYHGYKLCAECCDRYDNKTGYCSLSCCISGRCDESC